MKAKPRHMDRQIVHLPSEVRFCKKCVISNQRPRIVFDEEGVCSACRFAERKAQIDWAAREKMLEQLLDGHRRADGLYDVLVPCSGGKDGGFVAHQLKHRWGMNPLTVTWAPHEYTDVGFRNFRNFTDAGFDNILGTPNGALHRKLAKLAFMTIGDAFQPFSYGQLAFCFHMAVRMGIKLVFYGENAEAEYGGDAATSERAGRNVDEWEKYEFKGAGVEDMIAEGVRIGLLTEHDSKKAFHFYRPPSIDDMRRVGCQWHYYSYYHKWVPQENYYYCQEHTGFNANPDGRSEGTYSKYASLDDRMDGFHFYMAFIKFGIGRTTSDAAHEVRDGHITREEAGALVKRFDGEFPNKPLVPR